jgi:hypothetical protein
MARPQLDLQNHGLGDEHIVNRHIVVHAATTRVYVFDFVHHIDTAYDLAKHRIAPALR